ncbi:1,3-beta-galactosyl-N-acetylhexosamine phosphorylase [Bacillus cereus BAG5X1-1]|uniref:1,3-beta-galactosyl-N-acetylhexosamine phosphorylase n=1 Tax=Bacillus cereus BAG5X1-1 TaxID=1053189 RepID=J8A3B1_BACCE|nr:1,3-beta-galactosyl-N-acetylhexosamine phosphorylase [Bacillus cereus]EJQ43061.1 1,3-beta-galactosyl-N-acetylhexosamine phosphorylase [Bacillus cereus BAG5X1-1]MDM5462133.1 1,3-beta-galactosyl-N-acetylhexosamine phosphorylase [Bacillus cereus]PGY18886.1 1,3-beta-galactosyl-N-acetylhexosamine phosphorylase [Bacillus cereus]WJE22118.1 1,3-beta-galactosyl-N-acetylhexosamine phosphorylase [Bacillus cereus]
MKKKKGRVTLPSEENFLKETKELMERWGADAIRDSDGTKLDDDIKQLDAKIYTTYFVARAHNEFAEKHMDECQQLYLMSLFNTALTDTLEIDFMKGYFEEQLKPDYVHSPKKYWEVIDRTTGEVVDVNEWEVNEEQNRVLITKAIPWHEYTVSFLVYAIWDPTQMYNHITNNWGDKPHDIPFDVRQPHSNKFMKTYLKQWLTENPDTDVVRFTTFFYHFTLVFNNLGKEKFVDWFGYGASVSVAALDAFQKEKGYRLRPEDIVDQGYYNTSFRIPTPAFLDYIDFVHKFVAEEAKKLVDIVHESGKEVMMFLGDNWIGTEPYGKYFENIGLDAVVGSVGGGATLRMIADIPHVRYTEGRFLPYFFPDTFYEGNNPTIEANENWLTARRALLRNPVDRIGYGGYLSLAYQFPEFISYIEKVTEEFREIHDTIKGVKPYSGLKVAILNSWGKLRTWQTHMVAHALWYKQIYSYLGVLESLSGAAVEVTFISFDDVINDGIPEDIDVIINAGDVGTAFSGGTNWINEKLVTTIRAWMYNGGGFIGIGEPTAYQHEGHYFQLANVLGVDKELGFSLSTDKYFINPVENHFISDDSAQFDFGEGMKNIYALSEETEIIEYSNGEIHLSSHQFGEGRSVYIAGLPYSEENTRLLMRALYYAAHKEAEFNKYHASNIYCEVHAYPSIQKMAIVNNSMVEQMTGVYDGKGNRKEVTLAPSEIRWEDFSNEG